MNEQQQVGQSVAGDISDLSFARFGVSTRFILVAEGLLLEDAEVQRVLQSGVGSVLQDFDEMAARVGQDEIGLPVAVHVSGEDIGGVNLFKLALERREFLQCRSRRARVQHRELVGSEQQQVVPFVAVEVGHLQSFEREVADVDFFPL